MPDPKEAIQEVIDPNLGGDYPIDSVLKVSDTGKPSSTISFCSLLICVLYKLCADDLCPLPPDCVPREVVHACRAHDEAHDEICSGCSHGALIQGQRANSGT